MDPAKLTEYIGRVGVAGLLAAVLISGSTGMWVFGSTYQACLAEKNEWKAMALKALTKAEQAGPRVIGMPTPPAPSPQATIGEVRRRVEALEGR